MINIKDFNSSSLKLGKKSYKDIGIYNIGYITNKEIDVYENIYCLNPVYLIIGKKIGHIERSSLKRRMEINIYFLIRRSCTLQMKTKGS